MAEHPVDTLVGNFKEQLKKPVKFPGLWGFYGWNYEAAVALEALKLEDPGQVEDCLKNALKFPHAGFFMKAIGNANWLYSVGDRIGLFGALYEGIDDEVFKNTLQGVLSWPSHKGLFLRNIGWGLVFGIRPTKVWIWADDVFMGGIPLLKEDPEKLSEMLRGAQEILKEKETGLWHHGVKINSKGEVVANNKMKWGRAHAWILLTYARYADVTNTEDALGLLRKELNDTRRYQRQNGSFGNLVDMDDSPDESSLTTIFIYAIGVLVSKSGDSDSLRDAAKRAWDWLGKLQTEGFKLSETCGACPLSTVPRAYNKAVGFSSGPAVAFTVWAKAGQQMLGL